MNLHDCYTCHNCTRDKATFCATCKRVNDDEIRIRNGNADHLSILLNHAQPKTGTERITNLPETAEESLLHFIQALTSLDAIGVLLTHFIAQGGVPTHFPAYIASLSQKLSKTQTMTRQAIHHKWGCIVETFEPLKSLQQWKPHKTSTTQRAIAQ